MFCGGGLCGIRVVCCGVGMVRVYVAWYVVHIICLFFVAHVHCICTVWCTTCLSRHMQQTYAHTYATTPTCNDKTHLPPPPKKKHLHANGQVVHHCIGLYNPGRHQSLMQHLSCSIAPPLPLGSFHSSSRSSFRESKGSCFGSCPVCTVVTAPGSAGVLVVGEDGVEGEGVPGKHLQQATFTTLVVGVCGCVCGVVCGCSVCCTGQVVHHVETRRNNSIFLQPTHIYTPIYTPPFTHTQSTPPHTHTPVMMILPPCAGTSVNGRSPTRVASCGGCPVTRSAASALEGALCMDTGAGLVLRGHTPMAACCMLPATVRNSGDPVK